LLQISQHDGKVFVSLTAGCGDGDISGVESLLVGVRTAERCFVTVLHDRKFADIHFKAGW